MIKLNLNINSLISLLSVFFICGKNSVYKKVDYAYRIIESAIENKSLEAMSKITGFLSADRVLEKLHEINYGQIQRLVFNVNKTLVIPKEIILAIDFTEKDFYGNKNLFEIIGSKGGKYVRRFIEISIVKPALFINAFPVNIFTNNKVKLISHLIDGFYGLFSKTKIKILLLDRGFFSKRVVEYLVKNKIPFIMPAIKNREIKYLAEACLKIKGSVTIEYLFGKTKIFLVFVKINDEVLVYATNTKHSALKIHLLYKKRWQIETNFREQNNFEFKTKTLDFNARYFAFVLAGLLFNYWQLTRNKKTKIESYIFKEILVEEIGRIFGRKKLNYLLVT